jgi:DNA uptake protein ComE-like DNA-binding protein
MRTLRCFTSLSAIGLVVLIIACNKPQNADEIRERTAEATSTLKQDTEAVVDGVKEGMASDKTVNINKASREDLLNLPGITQREADRIVAERPFDSTHDLVGRKIVSEAEFDKIRQQITATP